MQKWFSDERTRCPRERFGTWADALAQAFVRLEPSDSREAAFFGRIEQTAGQSDFSLSSVTASAHRVTRLRDHIAGAAEALCFINVQVAGTSATEQNGQQRTCRPGDVAIVRTTEPFSILNPSRFSLVSVTVPESSLSTQLVDAGGIALSHTHSGRCVARHALATARTAQALDHQGLDPAPLIRQVVELLQWAFRQKLPPASKPAPFCLRSLKGRIEASIEDGAELSLESLAASLDVSGRTIQRAFARQGETFSAFVAERRMAYAARLLADPSEKGRTVLEIALQSGFVDLSSFYHAFRARFGCTPGAFRRR
ncbi:MAG: helix-turn-helix domain-containing protein [Myxococcota bacterium]